MKTLKKYKPHWGFKNFRDFLEQEYNKVINLKGISNKLLLTSKELSCIFCNDNGQVYSPADKHSPYEWDTCPHCNGKQVINLQKLREKYMTLLFMYKSDLLRWQIKNRAYKSAIKKLNKEEMEIITEILTGDLPKYFRDVV